MTMWKNLFKKNKYLIGILIMAAALRLINLGNPPGYIFDEVYHAFTAREYLHGHVEAWEWWTTPPPGVAYEWTHPPVAKYGIWLGMILFGENSFGWRFGSAIMGVISILGLYFLVFALTKNKQISLLSAFLVSIEGLHIAQSRIAMNDIYMLCFFIWSLYCAVKKRWKTSALLFGLSLASKWSAVYGFVPLAIIYFHSNVFKLTLTPIIHHFLSLIRLLLIVFLVYLLSFTPFILAGHTWDQLVELHRQMWYYHTHLVATHAYQSTPWQWLFAARPVWYNVEYLKNAIANIYVQSNPTILWLGLLAFVIQLKKIFRYPFSIIFLLYVIFTLPWFLSPRIMFFYHYLPSAVFLCVILASWLDDLPKNSTFYILVFCSLILILISPMLFGYPVSTLYWDSLFNIFPSWK